MEQAQVLTAVLVTLVGAVSGSFLSVVIARLPLKQSVLRPLSRCPKCERPIRWVDNLPIVSFIVLHARCRDCRQPISWRYPLVEVLTASLALGLWWRFGLSKELAVHFGFSAALIAVTFIDLDYQIIPNEISLPGIVLGFVASFLWPGFWLDSLIGLGVGGGVFLVISLIFELFRGRPGMGMGDVKLLAMLGAWLGWRSLIFIFLFSSVQGILVSVGLWVAGVKLREPLPEEDEGEPPRKPSEAKPAASLLGAAIPFGCFLALAAIEYLFLGQWFADLMQRLASGLAMAP